MAALLVVGPLSPAFAQSPAQNPPSNPAPAPSTPSAPQGSSIAPVSSLGLAKYNFTNGPKAFPSLLKPYQQIQVDQPVITNSPRLDQLIHDGKLELTLQDAVELALENSIDIAVQRYYPWIADASILKAKSGALAYATPGSLLSSSTANVPILSYDPTFTAPPPSALPRRPSTIRSLRAQARPASWTSSRIPRNSIRSILRASKQAPAFSPVGTTRAAVRTQRRISSTRPLNPP